MKVALVHDDFTQIGGAENLFATIANLYPKAPIYTSLVNWEKLPQSVDRSRIVVSWMQKIPFGKYFFKVLLPFYPIAFESFDLSKFDLVISSTTRFAKGVITKPNAMHICYINSLPRFLWNQETRLDYLPVPFLILLKPFFVWLRRWDKVASSRPDFYIANSQNVVKKLKKVYGANSKLVYPFADIDFYRVQKMGKAREYFLIVSRLVKWKKIDIAIKACAGVGKKLIIVGDGPDKNRLRQLASKSKEKVEFKGKVTKEELKELYQSCQALIVTQEEDFGIAAVEAQACGRPVIAFGIGGQAEIVINKKTGILFSKQNETSLKDAITAVSRVKWNTHAIRQNALRFSREVFVSEFKKTAELYASKS